MAKTLARVFGVIVLLLGIIGFFSNSFMSASGYFFADTGMNIVNALLGIVLLAVSGTEAGSALWLKIIGVAYFIVSVIGFAILGASGTVEVLGFMGVNAAASWLYLVMGVIVFLSGFAEDKGMANIGARAHA